MVEIFKTNVSNTKNSRVVTGLLHMTFPHYEFNFDLYDKDQILRVESLNATEINNNSIKELVSSLGFEILRIE